MPEQPEVQPEKERSQDDAKPETENDKSTKKHPLDYATAAVAVLSLLLNVYLLYDKRHSQAIDQPGPRVFRIYMPARDALILDGLRAKKELFFAAFPNPGFLLTAPWRDALNKAAVESNLELRDESWCFLTLQNFTNAQYTNASLETTDGKSIAIGALDSQSTRFIYCQHPNCEDAVRLRYQLLGDRGVRETLVPKPTGTESRVLTELDTKRLGSLEDVSDRVRALIESKAKPIE